MDQIPFPEGLSPNIQLLWEINAEHPECIARLQGIIAAGHTEEVLFRCCNEEGLCIYEGPDDPNALWNRFPFWPTKLMAPHDEQPLFHAEYYAPSADAVQETRRLTALSANGYSHIQERPVIAEPTHADYLEYFDSFHPEVLRALLRDHLAALEISRGCNSPCRNMCAQLVEGPVSGHIPVETIDYLLDEHTDELRESSPSCTFANELQFYRSDGKSAIYFIKRFQEKLGTDPYISIVFGLDEQTVNFLYEAIQAGIHIRRISRLCTGLHDEDIDKLFEALQKTAKRRGGKIPRDVYPDLRIAFQAGGKTSLNTCAGNAIKPHTPESKMATYPYSALHGVVLRANRGTEEPFGFYGMVTRPISRRFPHGFITVPIHPDENSHILMPQKTFTAQTNAPLGRLLGSPCVESPRWTRFDNRTGDILEQDKRSYEEERNFGISQYKKQIAQLTRGFTGSGHVPTTEQLEEAREIYSGSKKARKEDGPNQRLIEAALEEADDHRTITFECDENLDINTYAQKQMKKLQDNAKRYTKMLQETFEMRQALCETYQDDPEALAQIIQFDDSLESIIRLRSEHLRIILAIRMKILCVLKIHPNETIPDGSESFTLWDIGDPPWEEITKSWEASNAILAAKQSEIEQAATRMVTNIKGQTGETIDFNTTPAPATAIEKGLPNKIIAYPH